MKKEEAVELLNIVEPGMVITNKEDYSFLIVRNLGGGRYLCISEMDKIVIINLLVELETEESISGIYTLPNSLKQAMDNAINNGFILEGGKLDEEDLTWTNGNLQREIWTPRKEEEEKEKPELPSFLEILEYFLSSLSGDMTEVKIIPLEEDGKAEFRMIIKVQKNETIS